MRNAVGAIIILALAATPAAAGFPGDVPDRVQVTFGGIVATVDSQASAGKTRGGLGGTIVFEDFFNLPITNRTGFLNGSWRIGGRHYLDFGWLNIDRSGSRVLEEDKEFKGYTFLSGAEVTGGLDSAFPYAAYRYDFLQLDQVKISGSAGICYIDLAASLSADGGVLDPDGNLITGAKKVEMAIGLPVPLIGFQLDWALSRRNSLVFYGRLIYVDISGLRAGVTNQSYHYYFHATKHFAIGAGFDRISIDIPKYVKEDQYATFSYKLSGASIYGKLSF